MLTQTNYRFRNDNGSETTATCKAPINNPLAVPDADLNFRMRIASFDNSSPSALFTYRLQYKLNSGSWTDVTIISDVIRLVASSNFTHLDPTTQQITSGSFVAGKMYEDTFTFDTSSVNHSNAFTEIEYMVSLLSADVVVNDVVYLRLATGDGAAVPLDNYDVIPSIQIISFIKKVLIRRN
jgi:hypothetical protein